MTHPDALALQQRGERLRSGHAALRTAEEEKAFKSAMKIMHELYTSRYSDAVVLPSVPESAANRLKYLHRGWCFFEFAISADYGRLVNSTNESVDDLLKQTHVPLKHEDFTAQFEAKRFTNKGDSNEVLQMYKKLSESEPARNSREAWFSMAAVAILLILNPNEWVCLAMHN
mmetsp:Transcript_101754/g.328362  ORF Transcript_101754/g.328362 Transcript_101754/m.328362 type:complete len:172 (+) Transcript_101754:256-771(+)